MKKSLKIQAKKTNRKYTCAVCGNIRELSELQLRKIWNVKEKKSKWKLCCINSVQCSFYLFSTW